MTRVLLLSLLFIGLASEAWATPIPLTISNVRPNQSTWMQLYLPREARLTVDGTVRDNPPRGPGGMERTLEIRPRAGSGRYRSRIEMQLATGESWEFTAEYDTGTSFLVNLYPWMREDPTTLPANHVARRWLTPQNLARSTNDDTVLTLDVPAEAQLWHNGQPTTSTGSRRRFSFDVERGEETFSNFAVRVPWDSRVFHFSARYTGQTTFTLTFAPLLPVRPPAPAEPTLPGIRIRVPAAPVVD